ncbi:homocysteine S-methyltransferase YbgG-like [Lytechinus variegatus]|uniref:homocysteine S-methyltransferase YbgG-like n=1 Tax=Lytechinus variegatus TaxID=7654 RepID=UPI001BB26FA1|nr:homocysteine S-methyltransferase YbgG-like [Lytechinus variegatus]
MSSRNKDMIIIDGGLSTELIRLGYPIDLDPLWTSTYLLKNPDALKRAHLSFLEHGADVILTGTYQASPELFEKVAGIGDGEFNKLMATACDVARQAVLEFWETQSQSGRRKPLVAGSVGPYGACLHDFSEYHGNYVDNMTIEELKQWHRPRMKALVEASVDLLALETIPSIVEAEALLALLQEFPTMKAWMTFYCKDQSYIGHGESLAEAISNASACSQIIGVGVNCVPAENVTALLQSATTSLHGKPFVVYPNAPGEQWIDDKVCGKTTAVDFDDLIPAWIEAGARYIGGCCGTSALDVKHLSEIISKR